jgi:hypothetical protein
MRMSMFHVSVRHGRTRDDACARLAMAVDEVKGRFGPMIQRVDWSAVGDAVTLQGTGFVVEMRVDAQDVHVSGDVPLIGALLGRSFESGVRQIVDQTFGKR